MTDQKGTTMTTTMTAPEWVQQLRAEGLNLPDGVDEHHWTARYESGDLCGHHHRSETAAERCLTRACNYQEGIGHGLEPGEWGGVDVHAAPGQDIGDWTDIYECDCHLYRRTA